MIKKRPLLVFFLLVLCFSFFSCTKKSNIEILNLPEKINVELIFILSLKLRQPQLIVV